MNFSEEDRSLSQKRRGTLLEPLKTKPMPNISTGKETGSEKQFSSPKAIGGRRVSIADKEWLKSEIENSPSKLLNVANLKSHEKSFSDLPSPTQSRVHSWITEVKDTGNLEDKTSDLSNDVVVNQQLPIAGTSQGLNMPTISIPPPSFASQPLPPKPGPSGIGMPPVIEIESASPAIKFDAAQFVNVEDEEEEDGGGLNFFNIDGIYKALPGGSNILCHVDEATMKSVKSQLKPSESVKNTGILTTEDPSITPKTSFSRTREVGSKSSESGTGSTNSVHSVATDISKVSKASPPKPNLMTVTKLKKWHAKVRDRYGDSNKHAFCKNQKHVDYLASYSKHIAVEMPFPLKLDSFRMVLPIIENTVKAYKNILGTNHSMTLQGMEQLAKMHEELELLQKYVGEV